MKKIIYVGIVGVLLLALTAIPTIGRPPQQQSIYYQPPDFQEHTTINDWWTIYRHDAAQTGRSTSEAPDIDNLVWSKKIDADNLIYHVFPPLVYKDKIYIMIEEHNNLISTVSTLYCINATYGDEEWSKELCSGLGGSTSATIYKDELFVSTYDINEIPLRLDGNLIVLNVENGDLIREKKFDGEALFIGAISKDKIYTSTLDVSGNGTYYCLDLNGNIDWTFDVDPNCFSPPVLANNRVYVTSYKSTGIIYCLDAENDGAVIWESYPYHDDLALAYDLGKLYLVEIEDHVVCCLDQNNGKNVYWAHYIYGSEISTAPAILNDKVYFTSKTVSNKNYLNCVNESGVVWSEELLIDEDPSPPIIADGKVFVVSGNKLYCFKAETGNLIWDSRIDNGGKNSLAIANGKLHALAYTESALSIYTYKKLSSYNNPPNAPTISGPDGGTPGEEYEYTFVATDPEGDKVRYFIEWGDGKTNETGYFASDVEVVVSHIWDEEGTYDIRAKAIDIHGAEGPWGYKDDVKIPVNNYQEESQSSSPQS